MSFIRSENPIWYFVDNLGNQLNDTYYIFYLTNVMPYIPQNVYEDPDGTIPWANPLQFQPNGTLPDNIYFDASLVYRLEVRQGPLQTDPLAFQPVENYIPGGGGSTPPVGTTIIANNQITNPQFAIVNFQNTPDYQLSSVTDPVVEIAPGWEVIANGTGDLKFAQLTFTSDDDVPTNASYGLQVLTSGSWTSVKLRQRFHHMGTIWSNGAVSVSLTATSLDNIANVFTVDLVESDGGTTQIMGTTGFPLGGYIEIVNAVAIGPSANTDPVSASYTDLIINLPVNGDIGITNIQLVGQDIPLPLPYAQETLERQNDHLFHYYQRSILILPKDSLLVGWDFGLNPWQFSATTGTTLATANAIYTADCTILFAQSGANNISFKQAGFFYGKGYEVTALTNTNRHAIIQYMPYQTVADQWGNNVSSLFTAQLKTTHSTTCRVKMRLIYRSTSIPTLSNVEPILSWNAGGDPVFAAGWTALAPLNDPAYTLATIARDSFSFNQFQLPVASSGTMFLGIVVYTIDQLDSSGTPDSIVYNKISLVPNTFAIDCNPKTWDQTLHDCQFFYETSYDPGFLPGSFINPTLVSFEQFAGNSTVVAPLKGYPTMFGLQYKNSKCRSPVFSTYSANTGTLGDAYAVLVKNGVLDTAGDVTISSFWTVEQSGINGIVFTATTDTPLLTGSIGVTVTHECFIQFNYAVSANLGGF